MTATSVSAAGGRENVMLFSEETPDEGRGSGGSEGTEQPPPPRPLKLMNYKKLRFPNPVNVCKNYLFAALIRISFDQEFSMKSFLAGAEQVILFSNLVGSNV